MASSASTAVGGKAAHKSPRAGIQAATRRQDDPSRNSRAAVCLRPARGPAPPLGRGELDELRADTARGGLGAARDRRCPARGRLRADQPRQGDGERLDELAPAAARRALDHRSDGLHGATVAMALAIWWLFGALLLIGVVLLAGRSEGR